MENIEKNQNIVETSVTDCDKKLTDAPTVDDIQQQDPAVTPDIARLISEAEQRGYIRGRNESIDSLVIDDDNISDDDSCPSFLAHIRPGFWD